MTTPSLSAVGCFEWESGITLSADLFIDVVLLGDGSNSGVHSSSSESQDEMESGFLLDVVVGEGSAVFELLSGENKSLLIGWDSLFILDLGLDVLNGVG